MNVVVNGRFLARRITGVERYGREIMQRLQTRPRVIHPSAGRRLWTQGWRGHLWEQVVLPQYIHSGDILWSPANTGPIRVASQVLSLHDTSPLDHPEWFTPAFASWYRLLMPLLVQRVRCILVPSLYMQEKVVTRFMLPSERITVVPGGVDLEAFHPSVIPPFELPTKYLLFIGSLQPGKNLSRLLKAWQRIQDANPDTWLLITGAGGKVFRTPGLPGAQRVKYLGYVPDVSLPGLYANASLFILPSLDEGFGLPVLEAMACGAPVAASNCGALPEVIGDAGLLFDPKDISAIAEAMQNGLKDAALQNKLRTNGFARVQQYSWPASAEKVCRVFERCR